MARPVVIEKEANTGKQVDTCERIFNINIGLRKFSAF